MSKKIQLILVACVTALFIFILSVPIGPLPPAGSFFSPSHGFWANAETSLQTGSVELSYNELQEPVRVFVNERGVPHIFAQNNHDLYFTQGYITARDRLFQMELQIRAAGGMLAEWMGGDLVEYDRYQRRLGLLDGARKAAEYMQGLPETGTALDAYSKGINAYINSLTTGEYPLEYKILNTQPQQWSPMHSALLLKYMTQTLASRASDIATSNTLAYLGEEFVNTYLSQMPRLQDPMVPPETPWDFEPLSIPEPASIFQPSYTEQIQQITTSEGVGSNNWAVSGSKTEGGYPILANDPHLNMTAPSIWYEMQLHAPGINSYGVTLPGSPNIIVGFNEDISWGTTNTGSDVMDWYEVEFQDETLSQYRYDGEWVPTEYREEIIRVKGGETVRDTIYNTHHGPVVFTDENAPFNSSLQKNHTLRWIAHEPSNELATYYFLNRAQNYDDFVHAMSFFTAPAQNKVYADREGNIALWLAGKFPLKWTYQGRTTGDGSDPHYDWQGFIPFEHNPHVLNPPREFVSTANQFPVDESYPYYLGDDFAPYERGLRINNRLREMQQVTVEDMIDLQLDLYSEHAARLLPVFLEEMEGAELSTEQQQILALLQVWDYMNEGERIAPSVFRYWWIEMEKAVWDDVYDIEFPMRRPSRDRTAELIIDEPDSHWFDNRNTSTRETRGDLVQQSFYSSLERLHNRYGDFSETWQWGYVNNTSLDHIARIPGLGLPDLFTGGGAESVNAIRGSHGPSWRMVVEMKPEGVKAYGVYPGGQSGNPGSRNYGNFTENWRTGKPFELNFLKVQPAADEFPLVITLE
ncbi:MAG: penicillin acylase family protein [Balneolaceae bacterium]